MSMKAVEVVRQHLRELARRDQGSRHKKKARPDELYEEIVQLPERATGGASAHRSRDQEVGPPGSHAG